MSECHKYDDIIDLPVHISQTRPHMSMIDRAAQFSPFAALTGYEDEITETARRTQTKPEITEEKKQHIDYCLKAIVDNRVSKIDIKYFEQDLFKNGGKILTVTTEDFRFSRQSMKLIINGQDEIALEDIIDIEIYDKRSEY